MTEIQLMRQEVTSTGLYLMRWQGRTGLVRVIGQPKTGWRLLKPTDKSAEVLFTGLPDNGQIPADALLSEPLAVQVTP